MSEKNNPLNTSTRIIRPLVVGLYAWLAAISFGLVLLDIVYARVVPEEATALSEAADFLLLVDVITVLVALGAIGLSWNSRAARYFLVASLAVTILGFLAYMLLSPFLQESSSLGTGIRIILAGSVSVLAFMGFYKYSL
jgi:hypothetical protein